MKNIYLLFFLMLFCILPGKSQQIYFYFTDASVQVYNIDEVSRMDFDANLLNLRLADESSVTFDMSTVLYYRYFAEDITAVEELTRPQLRFFPNPADQELNLKYALPNASSPVHIRLHNLKGEEVLNQTLEQSAKGEAKLDLSGLPAGQYFCTLSSGKLRVSKAFMKR